MGKEVKNSARLLLKLIMMSVLFTTVIVSCFKNEEETRYKNIIPEKTFISILTELHLSNGLFALPKIRTRYMEGDTSRIYIEIIESHGYSKEAMDTTLQYYYIKKPKRLIKIYDQILGELTEAQARLEIENQDPMKYVPNQWPYSTFYQLTSTNGSDNCDFEVELIPPGTYILRFTAIVFPDDQSYNPSFTCSLFYPDNPDFKKEKPLETIKFIKDGQPHKYRINGSLTGTIPVILRGNFYDFFSDPDYGDIHARIENISLYYTGTIR